MSNRLDSLNPKKSGAKPALKFKPKVVARKSKEDRDKNAPVVKTEERASVAPTRGRGGARGRGRGRGGAYVGTHIVSSGPFASSAVASGPISSSKTGLTSDKIFGAEGDVQHDPLLNLKLKSRSQTDGTRADENSDDEGDLTKINMSKEYQFDESETVLFPVRPQKDELTNTSIAQIPLSAATSATNSRAPSRTPGPQLVKSETPEDVKSETIGLPSDRVGDAIEESEHNRLIDDQQAILNLVTGNFARLKTDEDTSVAPPNNYFLVHLPQISKVSNEEEGQKMELDTSVSELATPSLADFQGQIGQLNFHRSGKVTMSLGSKTVLNVARGAPSNFLQELYIIDSEAARSSSTEEGEDVLNEEGKKIVGEVHRLGPVNAKLVAVPEIK